jgi:cation-transporting P-type ATPase E
MKNKRIALEKVKYDITKGLSDDDVLLRQKNGYTNKVKKKGTKSYLGIILSELFTYFNIIFITIAIFLASIGEYTQLGFMFIIVANFFIGVFQQIKSKQTIDKLSLLVESKVIVIRNGKEKEIGLDDIVIDDILKLSSGKQIGADSCILEGEITVNESLLTGESIPVIKKKGDSLLAGSYVVSGTCFAYAKNVGEDNYINKLSLSAKRYKKPKSEILYSIKSIVKYVGIAIIPIAIFLGLRNYGTIYKLVNNFNEAYDKAVVKTCGAILGMIPSGLFLLTSTTLAVSVIRLGQKNVLVQELYCIEMLARVNVVCMDKTGTITDGSMKVNEIIKIKDDKDFTLTKHYIGNIVAINQETNATSIALKNYFKCDNNYSLVKYEPFSSEKKYLSATFKDTHIYLGAPEILANKDKKLLEKVDDYAKMGYRVLLLGETNKKDDLKDLKVISLILLVDNIRQDAIDTIKYFKDNGVSLRVISGDNPLTVAEVATRAGIENVKSINLYGLSDEEVAKVANEYNVFGRVTPNQKEILIKELKKAGNTVAMIGDGVNDILALKEADCSIAVGNGADAARSVSHLILLDSKFSSMKNVVDEGRRATNNLKNASTLFLTKTIFSIVLSIVCIIWGKEYPFSPVQLLVLEFFGIGVPSFFLALQPNKDIIKGKFLSTILYKSLIGAIVVILYTIILFALNSFKVIDYDQVESLVVLLTSINGFYVLLRVSLPLNKYRTILFTSMTVLGMFSFFPLSNLFGTALFKGTPLYNILNLTMLTKASLYIALILLIAMPIILYLLEILFNKIQNKK